MCLYLEVEMAVVDFNYTAKNEDELSVKINECVTVIEKTVSNWWTCEKNGKRGLVPSNYLRISSYTVCFILMYVYILLMEFNGN